MNWQQFKEWNDFWGWVIAFCMGAAMYALVGYLEDRRGRR